jgi:hypothetical protein
MQDLYSPLLERDVAAIPDAVRAFRAEHSSEDLWRAVARFAVLAYAPSQHAKHAVLACLSAWELREEFGERFDDAVAECAIYAATSRQPWSEPPIGDPPDVDPDEVIDLATADRLAAERWLARHLEDPELRRELFDAASRDLSDLGHKLIVANAAWKLAEIFGPQARFATLRIAMWELTAYHGEGGELPRAEDAARLIEEAADVPSLHAVFLLDAALEMQEHAGGAEGFSPPDDGFSQRRMAGFMPPDALSPRRAEARRSTELPIYRYARDYGGYLKAHAVAKRWRARFPSLDSDRIIAAAWDNLQHGPSFEDFSFA